VADQELTQSEADFLIQLEKERVSEDPWEFPILGGSISIPLASLDRKEHFQLDLSRASIKLSKMTFQNRARQSVPLVRLDIDGPPHRNPDGQEMPCPHLHVYREGYADKWALPVPSSFSNLSEVRVTLSEFQAYCKITTPPVINLGLPFS
jgi:hypothetical protein